jgi:hypothetical protein
MAREKKYLPSLGNETADLRSFSNEVAPARIQAPPAHRQSYKTIGPLVSIPRVGGNSRDMQRHNKKKEQHSQQNSRSSRHFRVDGSDCRCDERDAYKVRPKEPPRQPRWH